MTFKKNSVKENRGFDVPSGKPTKNYGKIHPFFMGKFTISMAMFNSFVFVYQRVVVQHEDHRDHRKKWSNSIHENRSRDGQVLHLRKKVEPRRAENEIGWIKSNLNDF